MNEVKIAEDYNDTKYSKFFIRFFHSFDSNQTSITPQLN